MEASNKFEFEIFGEIDDIDSDNVDVYVVLENGSRYTATFFTVQNIVRIMNRYKSSGECLHGTYFWASEMIIIKSLSPINIKIAIDDLLRTEEFETVFLKIEDVKE